MGDQLEAFAAAVDFEIFRPALDAALAYVDGAKGGRPPLDPVMMFKVLVIQAANGLSDERAEYLINDRLSFMRFLGLGLDDRVPDARTIWLFRERLTRAVLDGRPAIQVLIARFDATLRAAGYIAMSGQIVDATLVAAPRQRNTAEEKVEIKAGRAPAAWQAKPAKRRHKDRDARWTVKVTKAKPAPDGTGPAVDLAIPVFGYQSHISIDRGFGFIRTWAAMDAAGHLQKPRCFRWFVVESAVLRWEVADAGSGRVLRHDERLKELSAKGDHLERLNALVDVALFRPDLVRAVARSDGSKGGRPPFDHVFMFKVLVLQASYSLTDERTEYLIKGRLSFRRFLGLGLCDPVPDANTIWTFREALTRAQLEAKLDLPRFKGERFGWCACRTGRG